MILLLMLLSLSHLGEAVVSSRLEIFFHLIIVQQLSIWDIPMELGSFSVDLFDQLVQTLDFLSSG
jgi:hypothetical protein